MFTLNCRGKLTELAKPAVMGIINATPDSFYAGSRATELESLISKASSMIDEGVDIIDIGGQSTRPGSDRVSIEEELVRVIPAIKAVRSRFSDVLISIDTFYAKVAEEAVNAGASIINDISGGDLDREMIPVAAALGVPYIIMHMKGDPQNMKSLAAYEDVSREVLDHLISKAHHCRQSGIRDIIIDPGFGFSKNTAHNFQLLQQLEIFCTSGYPVLVGLSRKSMVYKTLGITADEALTGTIALNTIALDKGANILRVHDVKEAVQVIELMEVYKKAASHGSGSK